MSLGFHAAGTRILAAVDLDVKAAHTFRSNFEVLQPDQPPRVFAGPDHGDLGNLGLDQLDSDERIDVLIGGPPCQGFSRIGRGKLDELGSDPRDPAGAVRVTNQH